MFKSLISAIIPINIYHEIKFLKLRPQPEVRQKSIKSSVKYCFFMTSVKIIIFKAQIIPK